MRKFLKLSCVLLAVFFVLTACGQKAPKVSEEQKDKSWEYIKTNKKIVMGLDDSFAPMGFRDEAGKIVGFDVDFANAVGKELGVQVILQPIDWNAKEQELKSKKIDVIWNGMSITPERKEAMILSKPYLNNTLVIMKKEGSALSKKADLAGKKVGVQEGSSSLEVVQKDSIYPSIEKTLVQYKNYDEAIMDLEIGRIDAVVIDKVTGMYKATKKPKTYAFCSEDFGEDLYAVGLRKEDKAFYDKLQAAIDKVITTGKAGEISTKWFGENVIVK